MTKKYYAGTVPAPAAPDPEDAALDTDPPRLCCAGGGAV